jgi:hypothetical protein
MHKRDAVAAFYIQLTHATEKRLDSRTATAPLNANSKHGESGASQPDVQLLEADSQTYLFGNPQANFQTDVAATRFEIAERRARGSIDD